MFSPEELNRLADQIQKQMTQGEGVSYPAASGDCDPCDKKDCLLVPMTPQKALVILGLLTGALEVDNIVIDRDRSILIVLEGYLKIRTKTTTEKKTKIDELLNMVGTMPFEYVIKTLLGML